MSDISTDHPGPAHTEQPGREGWAGLPAMGARFARTVLRSAPKLALLGGDKANVYVLR